MTAGMKHPPREPVDPIIGHAPLTTVELFCGIGGFRVAADRVGLKTVWANDLNALAGTVYRDRHGADELHSGDIRQLIDRVPPHDILTAGFPCQPFSAAGKKEGTRDPRGTLFQTIVDVLQRQRPRHFVLENVKRLTTMEGGSHFATVLAALSSLEYLVEWRVLNARHFGLAQNRERVVLLGTRTGAGTPVDKLRAIGTTNSVRTTSGSLPFGLSLSTPADALHAIKLATEADLAASASDITTRIARPSAWTDLADHNATFPNWGLALDGSFIACDLPQFTAARSAVSLSDILEQDTPAEYDYTERTLHRLAANETVERYVNGVEILSNQAGGARMGYTIFGIGGLAPTLTASTSRHYERYRVGSQYRRLTPTEYARLQGFADDHCAAARGYDRYKLLGNAVPPPMIEWVLRQIVQASAPLARSAPAHELEPSAA
ncbi:hypothetical protein BH11PSE8_BH11PSE8_23330 [soil metagenome]